MNHPQVMTIPGAGIDFQRLRSRLVHNCGFRPGSLTGWSRTNAIVSVRNAVLKTPGLTQFSNTVQKPWLAQPSSFVRPIRHGRTPAGLLVLACPDVARSGRFDRGRKEGPASPFGLRRGNFFAERKNWRRGSVLFKDTVFSGLNQPFFQCSATYSAPPRLLSPRPRLLKISLKVLS